MRKHKIQFSTDKDKVKEGEYVTVAWCCEGPDAVSLTVDNGFSSYVMQLPDSGSRQIKVEKSKGRTIFRLTVVYNGKAQRAELPVRVSNIKPVKASKPGHSFTFGKSKSSNAGTYKASNSGRTVKDIVENIKSWFRTTWGKIKLGWQMMPEKKRRTYKIIFAVLVAMWLLSLSRNAGFQAGYQKGLQDAPAQTTTFVQ